jgi:eukaryotic-like serine/threonine-protein kinase
VVVARKWQNTSGPLLAVFGNFQLIKELGSGSVARVFVARDITNGQTVAVKVLRRRLMSELDAIERFRREVFAVASISSRNVVRMIDFGISGEEVYIAMEHAEGPTLRDAMMQHKQWAPEEMLSIVGQIADALTAAHGQKIAHRDLKPENIVLIPRPSGVPLVKVLDFGFAKLIDLERKLGLEPLTRAGTTFGTPQYMAPEQIRGKHLSPSVDLFALAVIVYEMLAGRRPWDGNDPYEVMRSILRAPAPPLTNARTDLARGLDLGAFLKRALDKRAEERPADAATFRRQLEDAVRGPNPHSIPIDLSDF